MFFPTKMTMVLGIGAGGIIAISGFFVLIYACWRKHGSIRADKGGYTPLSPEFSGVRFTRSLVLCVCFVYHYLSFFF
jgi:hypothetical protein